MKTVKFRAKTFPANYVWKYGHYRFACEYPDSWSTHNIDGHIIDEATLGQYVGLNDSLGVEMFEKDIVDIGQTVNGQSKFIIYSCLPKMDIRYAMDINKSYEYDGYDMLLADNIKVIGNLVDNPELFKS